jgi:hypothetical protein
MSEPLLFEKTIDLDSLDPEIDWTTYHFEPVVLVEHRFFWTGVCLDLRCKDDGTAPNFARFDVARGMTMVEITVGEGELQGKMTLRGEEIPATAPPFEGVPETVPLDVGFGGKPQTIELGERIAPKLMFYGEGQKLLAHVGKGPPIQFRLWLYGRLEGK